MSWGDSCVAGVSPHSKNPSSKSPSIPTSTNQRWTTNPTRVQPRILILFLNRREASSIKTTISLQYKSNTAKLDSDTHPSLNRDAEPPQPAELTSPNKAPTFRRVSCFLCEFCVNGQPESICVDVEAH
ncbi:hypothetical protein K435DRAFT_879334 [Dendrothele bispora CBS 962.96]|uniref:Uncharacterized protein n=1 Tax=Dendrothele bispora (strain CBS 962.96) TaxID=1314807 RepID=A0A4S8KLJ0_DENBC|nr:hypothetical protein K435DRAFT_879334 [Dendrothele bispora CBS 962.96]